MQKFSSIKKQQTFQDLNLSSTGFDLIWNIPLLFGTILLLGNRKGSEVCYTMGDVINHVLLIV